MFIKNEEKKKSSMPELFNQLFLLFQAGQVHFAIFIQAL